MLQCVCVYVGRVWCAECLVIIAGRGWKAGITGPRWGNCEVELLPFI